MDHEINTPSKNHGTIDTFSSPDRGPYVLVKDILQTLIDRIDDETAIHLASCFLGSERLGKILGAILTENTTDIPPGAELHEDLYTSYRPHPQEYHGADPIRQALLPYADEATKVFAKHLIEENKRLAVGLVDAQREIDLLRKDWPEPYKRYIPQKTFHCADYLYLSLDEVKKIVDGYSARLGLTPSAPEPQSPIEQETLTLEPL